MTTYNTGNPLGSKAAKDLYDNAENLDLLMNGPEDDYPDRFGVARQSWRGMENDFQQVLQDSGYVFIGDYDADGPLLISTRAEVFTKDGEYWRAKASLTLPYTTVNNWAIDQDFFVSIGDAALRLDLADDDLAQGISIVARGAVSVDSIVGLLTVPTHADKRVIVSSYHSGWAVASFGPLGGSIWTWDSSEPKANHNGFDKISPTVPWNGAFNTLNDFQLKVGETTPAGTGCWIRVIGDNDIVSWGCLPSAGTNNFNFLQRAIASAYTNDYELKANKGTYEYGTTLDLSYPSLTFRGDGFRNTVLKFTGTGAAAEAFGTRPNNGAFSFDFDMSDMTIEGNANATSLLRLRINHARLRDINFREANSATGVALKVEGVVAGHFQNITCSTNTQLMANRPLRGITVDEDPTDNRRATDNTFINTVIEGMMEDGIHLIKSDFSTFIGGTSENNDGVGVSITSGSKDNTFIGMCFENAGFADVFDDGECNKFINCYGTTAMNVGPNAQFHKTDGGFWQSVFEDAGAEYSNFENIRYNFLISPAGTFVLNSSTWSARNIYSVQGLQYVTLKKPIVSPVIGASPWTFTNTTGVPIDFYISGGTLSAVDITRAGSVIPVPVSGQFYLTQGDQITVAYAVAPTVRYARNGANYS